MFRNINVKVLYRDGSRLSTNLVEGFAALIFRKIFVFILVENVLKILRTINTIVEVLYVDLCLGIFIVDCQYESLKTNIYIRQNKNVTSNGVVDLGREVLKELYSINVSQNNLQFVIQFMLNFFPSIDKDDFLLVFGCEEELIH